MIKNLIFYAGLFLINLHTSVLCMEEPCETPAQSKPEIMSEWFVTKYHTNYEGHFKGAYYNVTACACQNCSKKNSKYFVAGLRTNDPDANIEHNNKPSRFVKGENSEYIRFVYAKEWQYLKEDMIAVCLNPNLENMVNFSGMPFLINIVAQEEARNTKRHLATVVKGCSYNKTKSFPEDWQFSFSDPTIKKEDTFDLLNFLNDLKELTESGCSADKYMSSALVELRQLAEEIDTPADITTAHQEFFYHLVEFQGGKWGASSETEQRKIDLVNKACRLYKGIMSRNPARALAYRTKINQNEIKYLFEGSYAKERLERAAQLLSIMNDQIDHADINLSLFAGDFGKGHMLQELNQLKDFFKDGLQQKYNLAHILEHASVY